MTDSEDDTDRLSLILPEVIGIVVGTALGTIFPAGLLVPLLFSVVQWIK